MTEQGSRNDYRRIIFIDEETLGDEMDVALGVILASAATANRYFVYIVSSERLMQLQADACSGRNMQIVTLHDLVDDAVLQACPGLIRLPPGALRSDIVDLGLAMSDAVLVAATDTSSPMMIAAKGLGKPMILPPMATEPIPEFQHIDEAAVDEEARLRRLDPAHPGQRWREALFGRIDGALIHLAAALGKLIPSRPGHYGRHIRGVSVRGHLSRAVKAFMRRGYVAYFAPGDWRTLNPSTLADDGPIRREFESLDRAATSSAGCYRDLIWFLYIGNAVAVAAAIAGGLHSGEAAGNLWPYVEAASLVIIISSFLWARWLHHRWTACRIGVEQLRVARMALPLLVVPQVLLSPDRDPLADLPDRQAHSAAPSPASVVVAMVKRAIRDEGPTALRSPPSSRAAIDWLRLIVNDQLRYHELNHDRLEAVERFASLVSLVAFGVIALVVGLEVLHLLPHDKRALLVTAAGPAMVASIHGALARLEIARRGDLSRVYADKLYKVSAQLDALVGRPQEPEWSDVRNLVRQATDAMGSEADTWHATMLLTPVNLP